MSEISESEKTQLVKLSLPDSDFITSGDLARQIVDNAMASHDTYYKFIRACQKHISGEKPLPQDELKKKGLGWTSNFNYGKSRAKLEKGTAENISKVSAALGLGYVTFRNAEDSDEKDKLLSFLLDENKRSIVASAIGCCLHSTLAKEARLSGWLNKIEYPSYAFGYCALVFDKHDWIPEPVHPLDIAFKPNTSADKVHEWITFQEIEASDLYGRWVKERNKQARKDLTDSDEPSSIVESGWNLLELENVLFQAFKGKVGNETPKVAESWAEVMNYYNDNSSYVILNTENICIAKIFRKELNGTLSETYIAYDNAWQTTTKKSDTTASTLNITDGLLFKKNHGKFNQKKHINLIRDSGFSSDSDSIQDLRGIAKFSVEDSIRYNRLRNGIANKMQFVGAPMFEQSHSQSGEKFKLTVSQGFVLLPASHNILEKQPAFDISSHIAVLQFEENEFTRDTQQYDATIQGRLTSRPNKGEVQRVTEEVEFTDSAKNNIKFRDYANVFCAMVQRLPEVNCTEGDLGHEGKERFYNYLKKNLSWLVTTDSDIDKILKCVDSFVLDPVMGSIETITIATQMAETPFARNRLKRMLLVAKGMPIEEVNITVPLILDKFTNMQDARIAMIENDMFFTTNEVVFAGTDDDIVHLDTHLSKCDRVIKGFKEGALAAMIAFKYLENNLAHCLNHTNSLGGNPILRKKAEEYFTTVEAFAKIKDKIKSIAEQEMERQQAAAQELQLKPEVEADIASKTQKAISDTERKDWLAQERTQQRNKQIELSHQEKLHAIELENEREKLKIENGTS